LLSDLLNMRITFVNRLAGIFWGGGETFDLEVARALIKLGHNVQFLIGRRLWRLDLPMVEFPATYVRTPFFPWLWYQGVSSQNLWMNRIGWRVDLFGAEVFERMAFRTIGKNGFARHTDVFQINGLPRLGAWIKEDLQANAVIMWHGPPSIWTGTLFGRETNGPKVRDWNERCSATFSCGDAVAAVKDNADSRVVELSIGVDTERFRQISADGVRSNYNIPADSVLFVFVGRMIHIKNLPFLIETFASALRQDSHLYLLLVGDGPSKSDLIEQVRRLGIENRVVFAGEQTGADLVEHYNAADVFTITSTYDNFPFVVLEAMACELPVIATRVGGLSKSVDHGHTGLLVESGNMENFKDAMLAMAKDKDRRRDMGRCGREKVLRKHSWNETARQMITVYESL
jgi:glycosyltransferase involved in cell wall biosynthesis